MNNTLMDLVDAIKKQIYPPLPYNLCHALMCSIRDDNEDAWKNSVVALVVNRSQDKYHLPRLEGYQREGGLVWWSKWIPEGYGLFINIANLSRWYWSPRYNHEACTQLITVGDTLMTILQIEELCHAAECTVGQELSKDNLYYKVHHCDPLTDEQIKKTDAIANSNAYWIILHLRGTFE
jgi:hypothetical protein